MVMRKQLNLFTKPGKSEDSISIHVLPFPDLQRIHCYTVMWEWDAIIGAMNLKKFFEWAHMKSNQYHQYIQAIVLSSISPFKPNRRCALGSRTSL